MESLPTGSEVITVSAEDDDLSVSNNYNIRASMNKLEGCLAKDLLSLSHSQVNPVSARLTRGKTDDVASVGVM